VRSLDGGESLYYFNAEGEENEWEEPAASSEAPTTPNQRTAITL
jgi:hypothetical protein